MRPNDGNKGRWEARISRSSSRKIHGICILPWEYDLAFVPRNAKVIDYARLEQHARKETRLSNSYGFVKASVALLQTIYAAFTLVQSTGPQIESFGYAAFGLTVSPYVIMSAIGTS